MHTLRILGHKPRMNIRLLMQRSPKLYPYLFPKEYHRMCQSRYIPRQPTGTETHKRKNTPVIAAKPKLSAKSVIRGPALPWPSHVPVRYSHRRSTLTASVSKDMPRLTSSVVLSCSFVRSSFVPSIVVLTDHLSGILTPILYVHPELIYSLLRADNISSSPIHGTPSICRT